MLKIQKGSVKNNMKENERIEDELLKKNNEFVKRENIRRIEDELLKKNSEFVEKSLKEKLIEELSRN